MTFFRVQDVNMNLTIELKERGEWLPGAGREMAHLPSRRLQGCVLCMQQTPGEVRGVLRLCVTPC